MTPGFTQPVCKDCWYRDNPDRLPVRIRAQHRQLTICCHCGQKNRSGIYIRIDPKTVPYPQEDE